MARTKKNKVTLDEHLKEGGFKKVLEQRVRFSINGKGEGSNSGTNGGYLMVPTALMHNGHYDGTKTTDLVVVEREMRILKEGAYSIKYDVYMKKG